MPREGLEVADAFRSFGPAFREQHGASLSGAHRRAMIAIENCRTAALGGHVERCGDCGYQRIAYDSCRNRNCPKCQSLARAQWIADRQAELLDVPYFHVVFTVPVEIEVIAFQNQTVVYDIPFRAASETPTHDRRRSTASGCGDRLPRRAAHVGTKSVTEPSRMIPGIGLTRFAGAVPHRQRWPREAKRGTVEELGRQHARNRIVRQSLSATLVDRLSQPRVAADTQRCLQRFDSAADLKQTKPILARSRPYPHWLYPPHRVFHRSAGRHWPTFTTIAPWINSTAPASASRGDRLG
jgi:Transposase zinc-binding domain